MAGNSNSGRKSDKIMRDAIRVALMRPDEENPDLKKIHRVAEKLVELACGGDIQAIKEVNDRLDGKAHQSGDLNIVTTHEDFIARVAKRREEEAARTH